MLVKDDFVEKQVSEDTAKYLSRKFGKDEKYELCLEPLLFNCYFVAIYATPDVPLFEKIWCEDLGKAIAIASAIDLQVKGCPNEENLESVLGLTVKKWVAKQNKAKERLPL